MTDTLEMTPSLEVTSDDLRWEGDNLARLPGSWPIFVAHLGGRAVDDFVEDCDRVRQLGHQPVPHMAARRYRDAAHLAATLMLLREEVGVREALVLAGDAEPEGTLKDSLEVMKLGVFDQVRLDRVWCAGYPEGHPQISPAELNSALRWKGQWSQVTGIPIGVVTQLAADPEVSMQWCEEQGFAEQGIAVRISRFLFADPDTLSELADLAGLPALYEKSREPGNIPFVQGPPPVQEPATELCAPHYMALGALEQAVDRLIGSSC